MTTYKPCVQALIVLASTFVLAGMDTTSGALARILHLLALHPDVQDKLRAELLDAQTGEDDIPYDKLVDLPYLDAICRETLRLCVSYAIMQITHRSSLIR